MLIKVKNDRLKMLRLIAALGVMLLLSFMMIGCKATLSPTLSVDEAIVQLVESKEFKEADYDEKALRAEKLLNEYRDAGEIRDISYDSSNGMYSFSYSDGSRGGLKLEEFNPLEN